MKKIGIVIFALALVTGLVVTNMFSFGRMFDFPVHFGSVEGSGRMVSEVRDVEEFHGVDVGGVFRVEVVAGGRTNVEIEADDNLLPLITTHVDHDGILHISAEKRLKTENHLRVRITTPDVDTLDVSGAANVVVSELKNDGINVDASGASRIKISGETAKLTVDVSGATRVDADELSSVDASVDASGASNVALKVTGQLNADLSGASHVTYSGSPASVEKRTSGAASVTAK